MKRTLFGLFVAAAMISSPAVAADTDKDKTTSTRSAGAYPVVYDDYPESDLVIDVGQDVVLTITGEARTRFEWVENTTDFSSNGDDGAGDDTAFDDSFSYAPARFNLGFRIDLPRDVAAVIELQSNFELGGGPLGAGTELRANSTQNLRPGVINRGVMGTVGGRVGGATDAIAAGTGNPYGVRDPKHLEIVRVLNDVDGDGVFVYQGYIETAHIGDSIFSMRFGRQELAYGTEWLLGNQDWYDGQTFDGIKGIFEFTDKHRLDLFWVKLAERDTTIDGLQSGDDSDLYGAYFTAQTLGGSSIGMDAYVMGLRDNADIQWNVTAQDDGIPGYTATEALALADGSSYLDSWWLGVRFFREREHGFTFSAELTYQFGSVDGGVDNDSDGAFDDESDIDISAWGFESFLAYTWDTPTNPSIKGGVTWATGSDVDDYENGRSRTFFTPAGEIHPRLGLMDLVDATNVLAFNLGYAGSANRHSWGVDLWHFEFDEVDPFIESAFVADASIDAGDDLSNELGQEVDLWYNYQYSEHMVAQFAISYFSAGGFVDDIADCVDEGGACDPPTAGGDATDINVDDAWRIYANLLVRF